jgi:hypothetical protein
MWVSVVCIVDGPLSQGGVGVGFICLAQSAESVLLV